MNRITDLQHHNLLNKLCVIMSTICLTLTIVTGQDIGIKTADQLRPVALVNARIITVSGSEIERGYVFFNEGKIVSVDSGLGEFSSDTRVIDCEGKRIYPGLISARSTLGLTEISSVEVSRDYNEYGELNPEVTAWVSVNPDSMLIPVTRANGILTAGVFPSGGLIAGHASVMALEGWTNESMVLAGDAGLVIEWPWLGSTDKNAKKRALEHIEELNALFKEALAYFNLKNTDPQAQTDLRLEGLRSVLPEGDADEKLKPVFILAQTYDQITSAIEFARKYKIDMVLVGGGGVVDCLPLLKQADVPVMLLGTYLLPTRKDADYDQHYRLPHILEEAGISWCLSSDEWAPHQRNLPYHAGSAVAYGLPGKVAIRSITLSAAELLGVDHLVGSIEKGKLATLILTDGDVLELTTNVEMAFIAGREVDLNSHHTRLRDKYIEKYRQLGLWPDEK